MPPVADVFKGMSEEDIIKQVQEAEKFLKDLQEFGTPEEQAEFNKILEATLGSMSEQDFQDITDIAKMVEPHLQQEAPVTTPPAEITKPTPDPIQKVSDNALENFKTLITSIISRLDEIFQKLDSSKGCKEEVDIRWKNRATFNSMKRQVSQLKITRLAEKLSKKDLSEEEKSLVESLENLLKDITDKNNNLVIEDSFGFETKEEEHKYLTQAKAILNMLDQYIDTLIPKLEKFLTKWDPEALQLAKEASEKSTKAQKEAQDSLTRKPSQNASPAQKTPYPVQQGSTRDYSGPSQGYYPDYYDQYAYPQGGGYSDNKSKQADQAGSSDRPSTPTSKGQTPGQQINQKLKSEDANIVEDFKEAVDSYFEKYDNNSFESNIKFIKEKINGGYTALNKELSDTMRRPDGAPKSTIQVAKTNQNNIRSDNEPGSISDVNKNQAPEYPTNIEGFKNWYNNSWLPYSNNIVHLLKTEQKQFVHELKSAPRLCEDIHSAIHDMTSDEVKKITTHLKRIEQRFQRYKDEFESAIENINTTFQNNTKYLSDSNVIATLTDTQQTHKAYTKDHESFIARIRTEIGDKIENVIARIDDLNHKVRHKSKRKSKSSAISQSMQQTAAQPVAA
jgi:uncharacterized protein (DUF2267 family)